LIKKLPEAGVKASSFRKREFFFNNLLPGLKAKDSSGGNRCAGLQKTGIPVVFRGMYPGIGWREIGMVELLTFVLNDSNSGKSGQNCFDFPEFAADPARNAVLT